MSEFAIGQRVRINKYGSNNSLHPVGAAGHVIDHPDDKYTYVAVGDEVWPCKTSELTAEAAGMTEAEARKATPIATGVLDYFPDALAEIARVSVIGNEQHNPGEPLHWAKGKSTDEADALLRHLVDRGTFDTDGTRHSAKVAWRALALLQRELDAVKA